jgi:glycosyltransferase involved in cell wall biosynthesis
VSGVPILYVHHRPELGGAPRSLYYLLKGLDRERFDPHVYCPPGPVTTLFREAGATVHEGPVAAFTHIWASSYRGRRWLMLGAEGRRLLPHRRALDALMRQYRFPLVHLNDSPLVPAAAEAHRHGARIVWHVRGALAGNGRDLRSRILLRAIGRYADRVIAINESVAEHFQSLPQLEIVFNSVDLDLFVPRDARAARLEVGLEPDRPAIGFFSYIYPLKGYHVFIEAACLCAERGVNAQFVIVGSGVRDASFFRTAKGRALRAAGFVSDHDSLARKLAADMGVEHIVRFVPFTGNPELFYAASDIVAAPSQGPELGRSLIEAAATGRPVVASGSSTGGGVVLPGITGLLVPGGDAPELAEAIETLLASPDRTPMGERARAHAEANFDRVKNTERVMDIYERVLTESPAPIRRKTRGRPAPDHGALDILFVTPYYAPAWGFGGPPRVTWDLTRGLARRGHTVRVFTTDALNATERATPKQDQFDGVHVTRFRNVSNSFAWRTKKFVPPELVSAAARAIADFDVVHVTETRTVPTAAAFLAARRRDVPLCVSAHGSLPGSSGLRGVAKQAYDSVLVRPMLSCASLLCSQTIHEAQLYGELGGRSDAIKMLPLPVDLNEFDPLPTTRDRFRASLGIEPSDRVVMFLGRLHYLKGVDILMDAVRRARASDPRIKLLVVGRDDGAWETLERDYHEEFERGSFLFVGPLYGRDRIEAYVGCDVFAITPRLWEETSLSALEAAACGRPIVLTPQAEIPGLTEAGAGAMPSLEPGKIADALLDTLERGHEMGAAARELVETNHRVDAVVERLERYYREIREPEADAAVDQRMLAAIGG